MPRSGWCHLTDDQPEAAINAPSLSWVRATPGSTPRDRHTSPDRAHAPRDGRQRPHQIFRRPAEQPVRRRAELRTHQPPTRPGDPREPVMPPPHPRHCAAERHRHRIECPVGERQVHRVGGREGEIRPAPHAHPQHPEEKSAGTTCTPASASGFAASSSSWPRYRGTTSPAAPPIAATVARRHSLSIPPVRRRSSGRDAPRPRRTSPPDFGGSFQSGRVMPASRLMRRGFSADDHDAVSATALRGLHRPAARRRRRGAASVSPAAPPSDLVSWVRRGSRASSAMDGPRDDDPVPTACRCGRLVAVGRRRRRRPRRRPASPGHRAD